jgi:hypothetical protein
MEIMKAPYQWNWLMDVEGVEVVESLKFWRVLKLLIVGGKGICGEGGD